MGLSKSGLTVETASAASWCKSASSTITPRDSISSTRMETIDRVRSMLDVVVSEFVHTEVQKSWTYGACKNYSPTRYVEMVMKIFIDFV